MANYSTTKASIDANVIPYNNAQLITGEKMNSVLKEIVDNMGGQGYLFKGIASPSDPAITTDARVFFFATTPGAYTNKGGVVVNSGELAIITYDTIWNKSVVCYGLTSTELAKLRNLPTVIELESALNGKVDKVTGKGLSTNDYTDADKAIVDGVDATYAKKDGYYSQMGVGVADNLAGKGDGVPAEFTRRTTGGDASVADGVATLKAIKGKTIVWNQQLNSMSAKTNIDGISTYYDASTNEVCIENISRTTNFSTGSTRGLFNFRFIQGHKYVILCNKATPGIGLLPVSSSGFISTNSVGTSAVSDTAALRITSNYDFVTTHPIGDVFRIKLSVIDLTDARIADNIDTINDFKALFPNDYYPYNAGQLLSFNGTDIVTDGFNQFDGTKARVFGGKAYYINGTYTTLKFAESLDGEQADITPSSHLFTPSNDGYIFATGTSADFCINLSHSGYRNGQYEPYWKETKSLPSLSAFDVAYTGADGEQHTEGGLKSAGNAYDEQTIVAVDGGLKVKNIRRIGVVDLGNLNWVYNTSMTYPTFRAVLTTIIRATGNYNMLCNRYPTTEKVLNSTNFGDAFYDGQIGRRTLGGDLYVQDSTYSDAATFKASLAGVFLFYELEDPMETDGEVYNPNYRVSDFGTETILPEGVDEAGVPMTAPFNGSIVYGLNAVDTLRNLPKDYISKDSMDAILAAFVSAGIIAGYTLTFDATNNKYNCTITPNS